MEEVILDRARGYVCSTLDPVSSEQQAVRSEKYTPSVCTRQYAESVYSMQCSAMWCGVVRADKECAVAAGDWRQTLRHWRVPL